MKKYKVEIAQEVRKFLASLAKKEKSLFKRIIKVIASFESDPFQGKPLVNNLKGLYSYRISTYCIIYIIQKNRLIGSVIKSRHRKDVYK